MATTRNSQIIASGDLRHWITIQSSSRSTDASGQLIDTWSDVIAIPAAILDVAATETSAQSQSLKARRTTKFLVRWRSDITAKHRIQFDSRTFNIESVTDPDGRRVGLYINAIEDAD